MGRRRHKKDGIGNIGCGVVAHVDLHGKCMRILSASVPLVDANTAQEAEAAGAAVVIRVYQMAMRMAQDQGYRLCQPDIMVGDSSNTIAFLDGSARFKSKKVASWLAGIREATAQLDREIEYLLVPRAMNGAADQLATRATEISQPEWNAYHFPNMQHCTHTCDAPELHTMPQGVESECLHQPFNLLASKHKIPKHRHGH